MEETIYFSNYVRENLEIDKNLRSSDCCSFHFQCADTNKAASFEL